MKGELKDFYSVTVSGNFRVIFRFEGNNAYDVNYLTTIRGIMVKKRKPTHPGTLLEEHYIIPLKISKSAFADAVGIARNTLYRILNGKARITASMAMKLSRALKTSPELWLNLQQKFDIWEAESDKTSHYENIKPLPELVAKPHSVLAAKSR